MILNDKSEAQNSIAFMRVGTNHPSANRDPAQDQVDTFLQNSCNACVREVMRFQGPVSELASAWPTTREHEPADGFPRTARLWKRRDVSKQMRIR
jgi:hypothetical protein